MQKSTSKGGWELWFERVSIKDWSLFSLSLSLSPFSLYRWDSFPREQIKWHETRPVTRSSGLNVSQPHAILFLLLCSSPYFAEFPRPSTSSRGFMRYLIPIDLTFPYFVGAVSRFGNLEKSMKFDAGTRGSHQKLETRRLFYVARSTISFLLRSFYVFEFTAVNIFYVTRSITLFLSVFCNIYVSKSRVISSMRRILFFPCFVTGTYSE